MKFILFSASLFVILLFGGCFNFNVKKTEIHSANSNQNTASSTPSDSTNSNVNSEKQSKDYSIEFKTNPQSIEGQHETSLIFVIKDKDGVPIKDVKMFPERKIHLIIVAGDLSDIDRLQPVFQTDGTFKTGYTFKHGGKFVLLTEVVLQNSAQISERFELNLKGNEQKPEPLMPDTSLTRTIDGVSITLKPDGEPTSNQKSTINLIVSDASTGDPVSEVQNAQITAISEDTKDFVHFYPTAGKDSIRNSLAAQTNFLRGGIYKLWVQFQRKNKAVLVTFVVDVTQS